MKIRINGSSLRYRLSRADVARLTAGETLEEHAYFGTAVFHYALRKSSEVAILTATMDAAGITMLAPEDLLAGWENSQQTGFAGEQKYADGKSLKLLLEKDFKCLDETTEDQSDNYENPLANKKK